MTGPFRDRKVLEELWRSRLHDAKLPLDFARNYLREVQRDYPATDIPATDHQFAYKKALEAENYALSQYHRVLHIYTELTVNGIIPDEAEWLKAQAGPGSTKDPEHRP